MAGEDSDSKVPGRYLGHFVAGKLAARHGIGISLQASHSGGVIARVKLPIELIEEPVPDLSAQAELPPARVGPQGTDNAPVLAPQPEPAFRRARPGPGRDGRRT